MTPRSSAALPPAVNLAQDAIQTHDGALQRSRLAYEYSLTCVHMCSV